MIIEFKRITQIALFYFHVIKARVQNLVLGLMVGCILYCLRLFATHAELLREHWLQTAQCISATRDRCCCPLSRLSVPIGDLNIPIVAKLVVGFRSPTVFNCLQ